MDCMITPMLGGGFGGKEDITVETYLALLVQKTKRPVSLTFTREESLLAHANAARVALGKMERGETVGEEEAAKALVMPEVAAHVAVTLLK